MYSFRVFHPLETLSSNKRQSFVPFSRSTYIFRQTMIDQARSPCNFKQIRNYVQKRHRTITTPTLGDSFEQFFFVPVLFVRLISHWLSYFKRIRNDSNISLPAPFRVLASKEPRRYSSLTPQGPPAKIIKIT